MRHETVLDLLAAYLDGGLDDAETIKAIHDHLEGCPDCRAERDALAPAMKRIAGSIRRRGEGIRMPDVRWVGGHVEQFQPRSAPPGSPRKLNQNNHHKGFRNPMKTTNESSPRAVGRISPLAGVLSFVIVVALLAAGALALNGAKPTGGTGSAAEMTPTATPTALPSPLPTHPPSATPSPTPEIVDGPGGFVENAVDVAGLPEYVIPNSGGGGGGGGGGCPEVDATQTVSMYGPVNVDYGADQRTICLYDIPGITSGATFTVRLTSPSGKTFSQQYTIDASTEPPVLVPADEGREQGSIESDTPRRPVQLSVHFFAGQEYGEWGVEAEANGQTFASGSVTVETRLPVYSASNVNDPLDPFMIMLPYEFKAGDHLFLAARGLKAERSILAALYSEDPAKATKTTMTMVAYYASQITTGKDGVFKVEFVVGSRTPAQNFNMLFDPKPGPFEPVPLGFMVTAEQ